MEGSGQRLLCDVALRCSGLFLRSVALFYQEPVEINVLGSSKKKKKKKKKKKDTVKEKKKIKKKMGKKV